jgi:hypothetical protein
MPDDPSVVIAQLARDFRAVRDVELALHVPVVGDTVAPFMTAPGTDPAALPAATKLAQLLAAALSCIPLRGSRDGKEGSTVRVRQRALQKRRTSALSVQADLQVQPRAVCIEPSMELSRSRRLRRPARMRLGSETRVARLAAGLKVFRSQQRVLQRWRRRCRRSPRGRALSEVAVDRSIRSLRERAAERAVEVRLRAPGAMRKLEQTCRSAYTDRVAVGT